MRQALCFVVCVLFATSVRADDEPLLRLTFEGDLPGQAIGAAKLESGNLIAPRYPLFPETNCVLTLEAPAYLRLADSDARSFDLDNGDAVTFEAWVQLDEVRENVAIVSKGRTASGGYKSTNQNWAFRLRKNKGLACPNFLFRSRDEDSQKGDWHRWTANRGLSAEANAGITSH